MRSEARASLHGSGPESRRARHLCMQRDVRAPSHHHVPTNPPSGPGSAPLKRYERMAKRFFLEISMAAQSASQGGGAAYTCASGVREGPGPVRLCCRQVPARNARSGGARTHGSRQHPCDQLMLPGTMPQGWPRALRGRCQTQRRGERLTAGRMPWRTRLCAHPSACVHAMVSGGRN